MEEIWKTIKGFEDYSISNLGRVKSYKRDKINGKIMKYGSSTNYLTIVLFKDGKGTGKYIHRLVAEAFIPNPNNLPQINHIDQNTKNNRVDNLEWCDQKYNNSYKDHNIKMSNRDYSKQPHKRPVKCIETDQVFESVSEAARFYNVHGTSIHRACTGQRKTSAGKHWEFI